MQWLILINPFLLQCQMFYESLQNFYALLKRFLVIFFEVFKCSETEIFRFATRLHRMLTMAQKNAECNAQVGILC